MHHSQDSMKTGLPAARGALATHEAGTRSSDGVSASLQTANSLTDA